MRRGPPTAAAPFAVLLPARSTFHKITFPFVAAVAIHLLKAVGPGWRALVSVTPPRPQGRAAAQPGQETAPL